MKWKWYANFATDQKLPEISYLRKQRCKHCEEDKTMTGKINSIWAYIAIDKDGKEGIVAQRMGDSWMPFVFSDEKLVRSLRGVAVMASKLSDKKCKLVKFSERTEIEEVT